MLRRYIVSAEYRRYLEAQLVMAIHDTVLDRARRSGERLSTTVPDNLYDAAAAGEVIIEIGTVEVSIETDFTEQPAPDIAPAGPLKVAS
jgi:hypothetical protein